MYKINVGMDMSSIQLIKLISHTICFANDATHIILVAFVRTDKFETIKCIYDILNM